MSDPADARTAADSYRLWYGQSGRTTEEEVMQWITVATPPFDSIEQFDQVLAHTGGEPDGLEARYVGRSGDELRVITLWETKAHADRFFAEKLGPALAKALAPEPVGKPQVVGIDVARSYVR